MTEKPEASGDAEALRLAHALEYGTYLLSVERDATAATLRRLAAEVERLKRKEEMLDEAVLLLGTIRNDLRDTANSANGLLNRYVTGGITGEPK